MQVTLVAGEEEYPAKIVGFDADKDVAVLSIDRKAQASGWEEGGYPASRPSAPLCMPRSVTFDPKSQVLLPCSATCNRCPWGLRQICWWGSACWR